jgi:hypothetical protein
MAQDIEDLAGGFAAEEAANSPGLVGQGMDDLAPMR